VPDAGGHERSVGGVVEPHHGVFTRAPRAAVLGLVLRDRVATTGVGLLVGLVLAVLLYRFAASLFVGATAHDPASYVAATVILGVEALAACAVPARAAPRVEPVKALRLK
jgi:ABC-type antimicrobial peptide transport system permease subunit